LALGFEFGELDLLRGSDDSLALLALGDGFGAVLLLG